MGVTSAFADSMLYYIGAPGPADGAPAYLPTIAGSPAARQRTAGWRLFEAFSSGDGKISMAMDGVRLGSFPMAAPPKRVLIRTGRTSGGRAC